MRTGFVGNAVAMLCVGSVVGSGQQVVTGQAAEEFVTLFDGRDMGGWVGDREHWKVDRALITGKSDGKTSSMLVFSGREFGDFELRFDLRVNEGAGVVQMRGSWMGPLGVGLEVGTSMVQWLSDGSPFVIAGSIQPGEWNAYRVVCRGSRFSVFRNDAFTQYEIVAGHLSERGKLALVQPQGAPCDVEFRNIRFKELVR